MKRLLAFLSAIALLVYVNAQVPQTMSYQAVIRDNANELVTDHPVGMQISILQGSSTGTAIYSETHTSSTNENGLVTIEVGGGTPIAGLFEGIDWSSGPYFIKSEIDPSGGATYSIEGTSQIISVPYALYAKTAEISAESDGLRQQIKILEDNLISSGTYKLADIEDNQYDVVKIGNHVWMKENLKTTKYNDGTAIPNITDNTSWAALTTGAYCDYNNSPANSATYGRLYNWFTVDNNAATKEVSNGGKNVCPTGWHVPTDSEWTTLTDYLTNSGYGYEGSGSDIAKSLASTSGWNAAGSAGAVGNDQESNNSSGFTAVPGGDRLFDGVFIDIGDYCVLWSSTMYLTNGAYHRGIYYIYHSVYRLANDRKNGFSIRCLRDY